METVEEFCGIFSCVWSSGIVKESNLVHKGDSCSLSSFSCEHHEMICVKILVCMLGIHVDTVSCV